MKLSVEGELLFFYNILRYENNYLGLQRNDYR